MDPGPFKWGQVLKFFYYNWTESPFLKAKNRDQRESEQKLFTELHENPSLKEVILEQKKLSQMTYFPQQLLNEWILSL